MIKDELEGKTNNLIDRIEELDKKVEELLQEADSYGDEDEESDQDLDSELGDTLDVNDMKYPAIDKDKSSDEMQQNATVANANQQRLPSQASGNYEHTQGSFTENVSQESSPENHQYATNPSEMNLYQVPLTPNGQNAENTSP